MVSEFRKLQTFQIFSVIGQALLQFLKFLCSTIHSLPVINRTEMLVG